MRHDVTIWSPHIQGSPRLRLRSCRACRFWWIPPGTMDRWAELQVEFGWIWNFSPNSHQFIYQFYPSPILFPHLGICIATLQPLPHQRLCLLAGIALRFQVHSRLSIKKENVDSTMSGVNNVRRGLSSSRHVCQSLINPVTMIPSWYLAATQPRNLSIPTWSSSELEADPIWLYLTHDIMPDWPDLARLMPKFAWGQVSSGCCTCTKSSRSSNPASSHQQDRCPGQSCTGRSQRWPANFGCKKVDIGWFWGSKNIKKMHENPATLSWIVLMFVGNWA